MYSFAQRSDTQVVDEPFYAARMEKTGVFRPYKDQLYKEQSTDVNKVVEEVIMDNSSSKPVIFFKHMAKDIGAVSIDFAEHDECENIFLLRHPRDVVASYVESIDQDKKTCELTVKDTGFFDSKAFFDRLVTAGRRPIVIDYQKLLDRPEGMLRALCKELDLPFEKEMLCWEKGGLPEDGCWGYFWYHSLHASTGFHSQRGLYPSGSKQVRQEHINVVNQCLPVYEALM